MRRMRSLFVACLVGVVGSVLFAVPAHARVVDAYYGDRGHAWTNTANTRVGVEDQRDDGIRIFVETEASYPPANLLLFVDTYDDNNHEPGHSVYEVPAGWKLVAFRVCGIWNGATEVRGCGGWTKADPS